MIRSNTAMELLLLTWNNVETVVLMERQFGAKDIVG